MITKNKISSSLALLISLISPLLSYSVDREIESAYISLFSKEFGYTLIGAKSASIDELDYEYLFTDQEGLRTFLNSLEKAGNGSKNFVLKIFCESNCFYRVELINKKSIENLISENHALQHFIETKYTNRAEFFKRLEDPKITLFQLFLYDPYYIGLVLGYGDANSEYFCRRAQVGIHLRRIPFEAPLPFFRGSFIGWHWHNESKKIIIPAVKKEIEPGPGFNSLEAEWDWIRQVEWDLHQERQAKPPYLISLPFYVCRHGGDSEMIREKYKRAQIVLAELFLDKSFRETVSEEMKKQ